MIRTFRNSALGIIALAATLFTVPAQAQSWGQGNGGARFDGARSGRWEQGQAFRDRDGGDRDRRDRGGYDNRNYDRGYEHRDRDRRDYDRNYDRGYYGNDYRGGYVTEAPYVAPSYGYYGDGGYGYGGYSYGPTHNGRSVAIIGGSAVAGALIGGAAGHGGGAVVGALVGGVAGAIADQAVRHHDYRR